MSPFSVTVQNVPDRELGPLLTQLSQAGFDSPIITSLGADGDSDKADTPARPRTTDLPDDWHVVRERDGEAYRWPSGRDRRSRLMAVDLRQLPHNKRPSGLRLGRFEKYRLPSLGARESRRRLLDVFRAEP